MRVRFLEATQGWRDAYARRPPPRTWVYSSAAEALLGAQGPNLRVRVLRG